jgi:hypothetical protein
MIEKQIPKFFDIVYDPKIASLITLDEVRDAFHTNQTSSKNRAINAFESIYTESNRVLYIGSWFGILTNYLLENFANISVDEIDMDMRCSIISKRFNIDYNFNHYTADINVFDRIDNYDTVINLSSEHMSNNWYNKINPGTRVVMQSNNFDIIEDHTNCCTSLEDMQNKFNLTETTFADTLELNIYERYTLAGIK